MGYAQIIISFLTLQNIILFILLVAFLDVLFFYRKKVRVKIVGLHRKVFKIFIRIAIWLFVLMISWGIYNLMHDMFSVAKPVIYLYPETTTDVTVQLDYQGKLIAEYPAYDVSLGGWQVTAHPDSTLFDKADGKEYSYLFWEGEPNTPTNWDLSKGFVVKGEDTREFLQDMLPKTGLTPKEYNEFIVYWYPRMKDNAYNLIHFAGREYTDTAPLTITPKPDSLLRVFMVYKPLEKPIYIEPQEIVSFERNGFTVVEWGGAEL